jgi:glutamate dehydrogenase (NADP+)
MLKTRGKDFEGLRVSVSGSGNVAQYAVEKAMALGAKVVTVSDSSGTVSTRTASPREAGRS